jgi:hypothetical protein
VRGRQQRGLCVFGGLTGNGVLVPWRRGRAAADTCGEFLSDLWKGERADGRRGTVEKEHPVDAPVDEEDADTTAALGSTVNISTVAWSVGGSLSLAVERGKGRTEFGADGGYTSFGG